MPRDDARATMKRLAFNVAALLSLVACLALLLAWHRSPWGYDRDSQRRVIVGDTAWFLGSWGGGLRVVRQRVSGFAPGFTANPGRLGCWRVESRGGVDVASRFGPEEPARRVLGFGADAKQYTCPVMSRGPGWTPYAFVMDYAVVAFPYGPLVIVTAVLPALWLRRWLRVRRWETTGRCAQCGYDLRASPDTPDTLLPRCPECGAAEGEEAAEPGPLGAST